MKQNGGDAMQAVLYVGHGSRVHQGSEEARQFIKKSMSRVSIPIQEVCFLELARPTISEGVRRCVERTATRIAVVPVLLFAASHAKRDIPLELERAQRQHPHVVLDYGRPFGVDERIIDILAERIQEQNNDLQDAMVLLVGRGSSDPEPRKGLSAVAERLKDKYGFPRVDTCYLAAARPTFEEGLHRALASQHRRVFIVPYLLFTGRLMNEMEAAIQRIDPLGQRLVLCRSLGHHPYLEEILGERVGELVQNRGRTCDDCLSRHA
jgi:sirohydrochlorin ferrochelatase